MPDQTSKIFGIGLSKTGTSSLCRALNELEISSVHYPHDLTTFRELASANYSLSILNKYQSITDIPVAPFYPQLDAIYPESKFILTVRNLDRWLDSIEHHWNFMHEWSKRDRYFRRFTEFITACVYGSYEFNRERFAYVYNKHYRDVLSYFLDRPDDLLVLDACGGEGWEELCSFLKIATPDRPYPHANRREEKDTQASWIKCLDEAIEEFRRIVPNGAAFILVDENGLANSPLDIPGRTRRMLERHGQYWGSPEDSIQAIDELESLRDSGAEYLVLAWHCKWWFDYYEGFGKHVAARYPSVHDGKQLRVFDLRPSLLAR
jgi:hypothetical protein